LPAGASMLMLTTVLTRDSDNNVIVSLTIANTGSVEASLVTLTSALIGSTHPGFVLPPPSKIGPYSTEILILSYPPSVGSAGTTVPLTISGAYSGGTFNYAARVVLP
jgi:hypothetical protein